ncbi:MAG: hypothetical protein ACJA1Y_001286, partial [Burkholderiaceae bacterium]
HSDRRCTKVKQISLVANGFELVTKRTRVLLDEMGLVCSTAGAGRSDPACCD